MNNSHEINEATRRNERSISRRSAVKIIAGTSIAMAISPSLAFADDTTSDDLQNRESLMNSWRFENGELAETPDEGIMPLGAASPYEKDTNGNWCNNQGDPIQGALLRGIDVSSHQSTINWSTVRSQGNIDFAIIRCGFGSNYSNQDDSQFINNVKGCINNGIPFGIYIYSYAYSTAAAQSEAEHVLRKIKEAGLGTNDVVYPVYLDLEQEKDGRPAGVDDSNKFISLSNSDLLNIASTFCSTIQSAGFTPGIYANLNWWTHFLPDKTYDNWSRWVAQYNTQCDYGGSYDIWQAGNNASVSGISTRVDINFDFVGLSGGAKWSRIYGQSHLDTMALISQTGWSSSQTVVIATESTFWDALTASSLAGACNCPILLTSPTSLSSQAKSEIARLGAKTAYVVGGPLAIGSAVDAQIKAAGCSKVERVYGQDQQGTARKIAEKTAALSSKSDLCIIATSYTFQDALSVSPYAFWAKTPIFLCESGSNKLSTDTLKTIKSNGHTKALIVGGPIAVSSEVESQLKSYGVTSIERKYGQTEYETSAAIASWETEHGMNVRNTTLATGNTYYDALAGGALCGKNGSVLVIANDSNRSCITGFIKQKRDSIEKGYVLGGPIAVSESTWRELLRAQAGR